MKHPTYGLMAEFDSPHDLVEAAHKAYAAGYRKLDAYSPFPIHGLSEAIGFGEKQDKVPLAVLLGGIAGLSAGLGLQYWASAIYYPLNVGGRPFASWPSFVPVTFELTILLAAFGAVLGMIIMNGFPQPYHPVFNVDRFALASTSQFFLCIESEDPLFEPDRTGEFLKSLQPREVNEVAH
jgi:hypothetical protein